MRLEKIRNKKYFYLFGLLGTLILVSTVTAISQNESMTFISGDDCLVAHSSIYILTDVKINYEGFADIGEALPFEISIAGSQSGMVFSAASQLILENPNITIYEGEPFQSKLIRNENYFTARWSLAGNQTGNYTFEILTSVSVQYLSTHPTYVATYEYSHIGTFAVQEGSNSAPSLIFNPGDDSDSDIYRVSPDDMKKLLGQVIGFISTIFVYLGIQLGMPQRKNWLRKKWGWTASKIRENHCHLGYFSVASIGLHLIFLAQTNLWGNYFHWYDIYPKFLALREGWNGLFIGLDLAAISGGIFLISATAGRYFKTIAQKYGYKSAIFTQQISYVALIFAVLHGILNGSWTGDYLILAVIQILLLTEVLFSRLWIYVKKKKSQVYSSKSKEKGEK